MNAVTFVLYFRWDKFQVMDGGGDGMGRLVRQIGKDGWEEASDGWRI